MLKKSLFFLLLCGSTIFSSHYLHSERVLTKCNCYERGLNCVVCQILFNNPHLGHLCIHPHLNKNPLRSDKDKKKIIDLWKTDYSKQETKLGNAIEELHHNALTFSEYNQLCNLNYKWMDLEKRWLLDKGKLEFEKHSTYHSGSQKLRWSETDEEKRIAITLTELEKAENRLIDHFLSLHKLCLKEHACLTTYYEEGFLQLTRGDNIAAVESTEELVRLAKKHHKKEYLNANIFLQLGTAYAHSMEYSKAIAVLDKALEKDPKNVEAYIERASCYFELGEFDKALQDFLQSQSYGKNLLSKEISKFQLSKAFIKGAVNGLTVAAQELPASLWGSLHGICHLLWAGISNPMEVPENIIKASEEFIEYLISNDLVTISKHIAPELHELVANWKILVPEARMEKMGFVLGKYGVDIIACYGTTKAFKIWHKVRRSNQLCNLKTMSTSTEARRALIQLAEERAMQREQYFRSVKLEMDKQGKHIVNHHCYKSLSDSDKAKKSIWSLSLANPEEELRLYAGKGQPPKMIYDPAYIEPGLPGYRERVDFGKTIGFYIDPDTLEKFETSMGMIHYSKKGAHIVPIAPKK
jgi:tetratricopeptide (TPR) repeat protein